MDTIALVDEQVKDGERLLDRLAQEGVAVRAAGWVKPADEDRWSLYLATPLVDERGPVGAYREVYRHLRSLGNLWITDSDIKLIGEGHPVAKGVLEILKWRAGRIPTRPRREMLGGFPVEEVYVYPPMGDAFKGFDDVKRRFPSAEVFTLTVRTPAVPPASNIGAIFHELSPYVGKVNAEEFEGRASETVLLMGPRGSSATPTSELVFVFRPEGWNTLYRPDTKSYERVAHAGTNKPIYELVDFGPLMAMKVETA